ncbi:MAG: O-antigen ligase domain-containing protein [Williamsia sp.]|nr:O-antigen ligase family protein [Williamsia sp.]MBJ7288647.1 O-antigen ligase domain-containing protein [Williamsia sp.]
MLQGAALTIGALIAVAVVVWIARRPQRGVLLLAALTPLHGLLDIAPVPGVAAAWKEGLVALTLLCAFLRRGRRRSWPPVHIPYWPAIVVFVAFGLVSAVLTYGPFGLVGAKVTFFYLALLVILWFAPFDARDRDNLVSILMGMCVLVGLVGIAQQIVGPGELVRLGYQFGQQIRTSGPLFRTFSTFNQPFGFGLYVMLALLVGGAVALAEPRRRRNRVFLCLWPVMAVVMATSVVRAAIVGLVVGVVWLAVIRFRSILAPLGVLVVGAAAAFPLLPKSATSVFFSSSSLGQRGAGWSDIISSIMVHPFGRGLGSSGAAADRISTAQGDSTTAVTASAGGTIQTGSSNYQPDNYYIKTLLELGPIGLWVFLALIVTALIWCVRSSRTLPDRDGALALGVSASIVAAMVASLVATYFEIFPMDVHFWLLLGVVGCATAQQASRSVRSHSDPVEAGSRPISANF